ncbi:hypothetical protein BU23DRAFT_562675 [Bimuria novae-zelandiae CBS 107.79]|uniref:Ubiquitin 3 binding protein But2 C-terminal domain-containing protein n=1 Tax=Bimuria novae-zelandiae CBS 107.79 TaxID=1447943 RepID=A0A6A5VZK3_9PLEO|nr:hypothetical protein BU23DRAFT_562675 [Bimuria novae-zelandiae CBS 107.79]
MLLKSFSLSMLLIPLGQAAQLLQASTPYTLGTVASSDSVIPSTIVNGTLTSLSIVEGSGCPNGTYHPQHFELGQSLNTYVDFDTFLFNSTTSPAPVTCTLSIDFEFVYPEDGLAEMIFDTIAYNDAKFEEGDVARGTNFITAYGIIYTTGDDGINGSLNLTRVEDDGPGTLQVGGGLGPAGTPGEVDVGTFQMTISISTEFGPGEFSKS